MIFYQYFLMQKRGHLMGPSDLLADIYVQFCCYMRWDLTQVAGEDNSPRLTDDLPFSGGVQQQRRDAEASRLSCDCAQSRKGDCVPPVCLTNETQPTRDLESVNAFQETPCVSFDFTHLGGLPSLSLGRLATGRGRQPERPLRHLMTSRQSRFTEKRTKTEKWSSVHIEMVGVTPRLFFSFFFCFGVWGGGGGGGRRI